MKDLEYILCKLRQNKPFINKAKSEFAQEEINLLGHILLGKG
jgi:hypothetical protein